MTDPARGGGGIPFLSKVLPGGGEGYRSPVTDSGSWDWGNPLPKTGVPPKWDWVPPAWDWDTPPPPKDFLVVI